MPPATATKPDPVTGEVVEMTDLIPTISDQSLRAEVDQQIVTAHRFPRNIQKCRDEAIAMATINEMVAGSCGYALERRGEGGKKSYIEGPTIRLAEICAMAWGNLRAEARSGDADAKFTNAEGVCWDLEKNVAVRVAVKRRITDKNGRRYGDDMVGVTTAAAASVAYRNAVFRVIPKTFVIEVYQAAMDVFRGDAKSVAERRAKALAWYAGIHVTEAMVLHFLERTSVDAITPNDLAKLSAVKDRIRSGEEDPLELFKIEEKKAEDGKGPAPTTITDEVKRQAADLKAKQGEVQQTPEQADRSAKIKEQAAQLQTGCAKGKAGCADDGSVDASGKWVCANHAPKGDSGTLPGMDAGAPSSGGKRKGR